MMKSINVLIENILQKNSRKYCKMLINALEINGDFISHNYKKDVVDDGKLLNLLNNSIKHRYIQWFLPEILFSVDESSINDRVFERCLKYPGRYRKTLLTQLAHINLKKEHLERLNQILETPEAFYRLFLLYLCDNNLSVVALREFLMKNKHHLSQISNYKEHLIGQNIPPNKIDLVEKIINKCV